MLRDRFPVLSVCLSVMLVYCGQMAGWIKMPLGTEVGLGPGDTVRWGPSSPTERGTAAPPTFWPMSIVAKRLPISATAELLFVFVFCYNILMLLVNDWFVMLDLVSSVLSQEAGWEEHLQNDLLWVEWDVKP